MKHHSKKKKKNRTLSPNLQYRWIVGLSTFMLSFLALAIALSFWPRTYETSATIMVRPMDGPIDEMRLSAQPLPDKHTIDERVNNQVALLTSDQTAQRAQSYLKEFLQTKACLVCQEVLPQVKLGVLSDTYQVDQDYSRWLQQRVIVTPKPASHVVKVTYRSSSDHPEDFRTLISIYLSAFQTESVLFSHQFLQEELQVLTHEIELAKAHALKKKQELEAFQKTHSTIDPGAELNGLVLKKARLQQALLQTQADLKAIEKAQAETQNALALSVPTVQWLARLAQDDELSGLRRQKVRLYAERAQWMSKSATERKNRLALANEKSNSTLIEKPTSDPAISVKLETIDDELRYLDRLIKSRVEKVLAYWQKKLGQNPTTSVKEEIDPNHLGTISNIDIQLAIRALEEDIQAKALSSRSSALNQSLNQLSHEFKTVPGLQLNYAEILSKAELAEDTVRRLEEQKTHLQTLLPNNNTPEIVLLEKPRIPLEPIAPNELLIYSIAAFLSLVLGFVGASVAKRQQPESADDDFAFLDDDEPVNLDTFAPLAYPTSKKSAGKKIAPMLSQLQEEESGHWTTPEIAPPLSPKIPTKNLSTEAHSTGPLHPSENTEITPSIPAQAVPIQASPVQNITPQPIQQAIPNPQATAIPKPLASEDELISNKKSKLAKSKAEKPDKKDKKGFSFWPFGKSDKKSKTEKASNTTQEKRILPNLRLLQSNQQDSLVQETIQESINETSPTGFKLFLNPLPELSAFIRQMEGDDLQALSSPPMVQLQEILQSTKQEKQTRKIGFVPVSPFITAQATLLSLSLLMAESGLKIALIDLDFSELSLSRWLGSLPIPLAKGLQEGAGSSEYFDGVTTDFIDIIYPLGKSVFGSLIPAGHLGEIKALRLTPDHMAKLANDLSPQYDFIFYALPAIDQDPSLLRMGQSFDGMVLVSHPGISKPHETQEALAKLQVSGLPLLGSLEQP